MNHCVLRSFRVLLRFLGVVQMAVYKMIVTYLILLRSLRFAALHALRAAGVEFTSARRIQCRGDIALQNDPVFLCLRVRDTVLESSGTRKPCWWHPMICFRSLPDRSKQRKKPLTNNPAQIPSTPKADCRQRNRFSHPAIRIFYTVSVDCLNEFVSVSDPGLQDTPPDCNKVLLPVRGSALLLSWNLRLLPALPPQQQEMPG